MSLTMARTAQVIIDLSVLSLAYFLAFALRFEFAPPDQMMKLLFFTWPYVILFQYLVMSAFGVHRFAWRYIGLPEAQRILAAIAMATAVLVALRLSLGSLGGYTRFVVIPLGVLGIDLLLAFLGVPGVRVLRRIIAERQERHSRRIPMPPTTRRTLLIGAGRAGVMVAKEVGQNPHLGIRIVGFVDDDPNKNGTVIQGVKVLGRSDDLSAIVEKTGAEQAVITIAAAPGSAIRRIVEVCEAVPLPVKIIPGIYEILSGRVNLTRLREVTIEDLLGREAIELDLEAIGAFLTGKRVLISGAGGSIGSELCRQVADFQPEELILLEQAEFGLFEIHSELRRDRPGLNTVPCIADVTDEERMERVFAHHRPHVVFHAAAHKHVPMMEWNPGEAIKNNVRGTKTVADAADRHGVQAFVFISTDKAVNPTSIMGATKRVAEIYIQALSQRSSTTFLAVRFGNVLGSAGSVIPVFKEQIRRGGPVTVTHPEMKRYFMTIPEACQLVMEAATMGEGGEIFVLDMGEPVKILQLAQDLIRLSGYNEDEIAIEFSGVRDGEKLFEELSVDGEGIAKTRHPKIYIGKIGATPMDQVELGLARLLTLTDTADNKAIREAMHQLVPEMTSPDTEEKPVPAGARGT